MNHSISSYEERLNGKSLIDFVDLSSHPENISYIALKYKTDMAFRRELTIAIKNNPVFAATFFRYFDELKITKSTVNGR